MENLAQIAARRSTSPSSTQETKKASPGKETSGVRSPSPVSRAVGIGSGSNDGIDNDPRQDGSEDMATVMEGSLQVSALTTPGISPSKEIELGDNNSGSGRGEALSSSGADNGSIVGGRLLEEESAKPPNGSLLNVEGVGSSGDEPISSMQDAQKGDENGSEEEPWGVILRNTIIRDLAGFGMEHTGPIGRSLISKVLSVSQDNYPEMVSRFRGRGGGACSPANDIMAC